MYIDIETSAGVKCGDGPIVTAREFEAVKRLDKAGTIRFSMPATDERAALVQAKRVARAWRLINGIVTEIGAGIIDEIAVKADGKGSAELAVSGDDLLRELTYKNVGKLEIGTEAVPVTTGPADIAALFPAGWSLDLVAGYNATLKAIHHKYEGESCLAALGKLAELTGEHFRLGSGRKVIWMQDDRPDSGLRAIQGGEPVGLESNPDVCIISSLEETQDTYDCYIGRVYAFGVGDGDARVNLEHATNNHAGEGYTISSDSKGWYFQHTTTWNAYGIERYMSFKDVNDATTLAEQAYEWMSRRLTPPESYRLSVTKLDQEIVVGSTIRVVYKRVVDTYVAVDINADLVVLESTTRIDAKGMRTVAFQVATIDAWPDSDTSAIIGGLGEAQNSYTHGQPGEVAAHHATHESGGTDAIKLDDLAATDDNTDLNATSSAHGLLPKLSGDSGDVLLGDGTWGAGTPTALMVEEQDGMPSVANVNKIKVTNGSLTDDGGGVVSLVTGGGGSVGGSGVANQVALWAAATTLSGDTGLTFDPSTDDLLSLGTITAKPAGMAGIRLDPNGAANNWVCLLSPLGPNVSSNKRVTFSFINASPDLVLYGGGTLHLDGHTLTVSADGSVAFLNVANTFTKGAIFQRDANSTAAFTVKDTGGQNVLGVDTINQRVLVGNGRSFPEYTLDVTYDTAGYWLSSVVSVSRFGRNCGDYPSAGFGLGIMFKLGTYVNDDQTAGRLSYLWAEATDATRKARGILSVYDTAEREAIRIEANGSAAMLGLLGAAAAPRQAHIADPSGGATVDAEARAAINAILVVLEIFGFNDTS